MVTKRSPYWLEEQEVKALRKQANRAAVVMRNLRQMADEKAESIRRQKKADQARQNFYSKQSGVDPSLTLTPHLSEENDDLFK